LLRGAFAQAHRRRQCCGLAGAAGRADEREQQRRGENADRHGAIMSLVATRRNVACAN
jgi:hypothetical protein